jgi:hypothetical protein
MAFQAHSSINKITENILKKLLSAKNNVNEKGQYKVSHQAGLNNNFLLPKEVLWSIGNKGDSAINFGPVTALGPPQEYCKKFKFAKKKKKNAEKVSKGLLLP